MRRQSPLGIGTRIFILGWCLWLLGSWFVTLGIDAALLPGRWMIYSTLFGLLAIWPVIRLSQELSRGPVTRGSRSAAVFLEWFCLCLVFQAVIWPLQILQNWSIEQTIWMNLAVGSWSLITALLIAMGVGFKDAWARWLAMGLCILVLIGEPVLVAIARFERPDESWAMRISPLLTVWELSYIGAGSDVDPWAWRISAVGIVGGIAWLLWSAGLWVVHFRGLEHCGTEQNQTTYETSTDQLI